VKKTKIFFGVPCGDGNMNAWIAQFVAFLKDITYHPESAWVFDPQFILGARPVHFARNRLAGEFLKGDHDLLWMMDADMTPNQMAISVLDVDADIVCGRTTYWKDGMDRDGKPPALLVSAHKEIFENGVRKWENLTDVGRWNEVRDVDACGTACIVIKRRVLEDPRMLLSDASIDPEGKPFKMDKDAPPFFRMHYAPNGQLMRGEDLDFTSRAKKLGYSVKYHSGARLGHVKAIDLAQVEQAIVFKMQEAVEHERSREPDEQHQNV
jgi:hypothetical protein